MPRSGGPGRTEGKRPDTPAEALRTLAAEGVSAEAVRSLLSRALIAPVITAHPSEVRRKSILDRQSAISEHLEAIDGARSDQARADLEEALRWIRFSRGLWPQACDACVALMPVLRNLGDDDAARVAVEQAMQAATIAQSRRRLGGAARMDFTSST